MPQLMLVNPRKRRTSSKKRAAPRRRRSYALAKNPAPAVRRRRRSTSVAKVVRRARSRARRNPIGFGGITGSLTNAAIGAGGALAVDFAFNFLPLPVNMKMGVTGNAVKAGLAIGLGLLAGKVIGKDVAGKAAAGALTVIAYDAIKAFMPVTVPDVSGLGYAGAGQYGGMIDYSTMGEYVSGPDLSFAQSGGQGLGQYVNG